MKRWTVHVARREENFRVKSKAPLGRPRRRRGR